MNKAPEATEAKWERSSQHLDFEAKTGYMVIKLQDTEIEDRAKGVPPAKYVLDHLVIGNPNAIEAFRSVDDEHQERAYAIFLKYLIPKLETAYPNLAPELKRLLGVTA